MKGTVMNDRQNQNELTDALITTTPTTKKAARAAGYRSETDLRCKARAPRRNAEPTFIKGEAFWSPDQLEKLVSDTSAEKLGLFVSEDAQPLKTLSFHRGCQIYYLVYRLSDCVKRQSLSPSERKRQRSSRLRRISRGRGS